METYLLKNIIFIFMRAVKTFKFFPIPDDNKSNPLSYRRFFRRTFPETSVHKKGFRDTIMGNTINLEDLQAFGSGTVLAEPIFNQFGQMLLPSGTELLPRHVTVLKTWGCKAVTIRDRDSQLVEKEEEANPEMRDRAVARVNWRLNWEPENALEKEIQQLAIRQVLRKFIHS